MMRTLKPITGKLNSQNIWTIIKYLPRFYKEPSSHIQQFEKYFLSYIGTKSAIMTYSARVAFINVLDYLNLKENDEIILPAYTYHIIPDIIVKKGLKPIFVDINLNDRNISVKELNRAITKKTKVIVATHILGAPCDIQAILKIAKKNNIDVIEDCAHSLGAEYENKKVGSFGLCGIFSFNREKNIDCLNGAMLTTDNNKLTSYIKKRRNEEKKQPLSLFFKNFSRSLEFWMRNNTIIDLILKNTKDSLIHRLKSSKNKSAMKKHIARYQPNFIQAIIGLQQIKKLDAKQRKRSLNVRFLFNKLGIIDNISIPRYPENITNANLICEIYVKNKQTIVKLLNEKFIRAQGAYMDDCNSMIRFKKYRRSCPNADKIKKGSIILPCSEIYSKNELSRIPQEIETFVSK